MPNANIMAWLMKQPGAFTKSNNWLRECVDEVKKMPFLKLKDNLLVIRIKMIMTVEVIRT